MTGAEIVQAVAVFWVALSILGVVTLAVLVRADRAALRARQARARLFGEVLDKLDARDTVWRRDHDDFPA